MDLTITTDIKGVRYARLLLERAPERFAEALMKAALQASSIILRRIKQKLSGAVLRVRTGNLRRSWAVIMPKRMAGGVGAKGGVGSKAEYAAYHEFGYEGTQNVRAHTSHSRLGKAYEVAAHTRNVAYRARPYANPSVAESAEEIRLLYWRAARKVFTETQA